jgi:hypothetical protein
MENLLETLVTMESIAKLKSELTDKIHAYIDEHKLFGDYKIKAPFEVGDCQVSVSFEVEWLEFDDPSYGKTIYLYLQDEYAVPTDGKYIYEINLMGLESFYNNVLLANAYKPWS